jgi:hypothetical protein
LRTPHLHQAGADGVNLGSLHFLLFHFLYASGAVIPIEYRNWARPAMGSNPTSPSPTHIAVFVQIPAPQ